MDVIGAIGAINAIIIAFFLYKKKDKSTSDKLLTVWIAVFVLHFSMPFFIERELLFHEFYWGFIWGIVIITHMPFLFVYTQSLVQKGFRFNYGIFWNFAFVIIYILSLLPAFVMGQEEYYELAHGKHDITHHVFLPMITFILCQIYFLIRTIIQLLRHQYSIKSEFSYSKAIDLVWIKRIVYGFAAILILYFIGFALVSLKLLSLLVMDYVILVANMLLFYYTAYSGYNQQIIFKAEVSKPKISDANLENTPYVQGSTQMPDEEESENSGENPITKELLVFIGQEKPYLEQELTLGDLANQLNMHAHHLSKIINEEMGKNFFEFINDYRIEEFKKLAVNPKNKHISILGLAMEAGFNSKATFNRFFKNSTGLTPSEFMKSYKF